MKRKASQGNHFSLTITHKFLFLKKYWAYSDVILAQIFYFINCLKKDPTPVLVSWPHQQGTTRAGVNMGDNPFFTWMSDITTGYVPASNIKVASKLNPTMKRLKIFSFDILNFQHLVNDFSHLNIAVFVQVQKGGPHIG